MGCMRVHGACTIHMFMGQARFGCHAPWMLSGLGSMKFLHCIKERAIDCASRSMRVYEHRGIVCYDNDGCERSAMRLCSITQEVSGSQTSGTFNVTDMELWT